MHFLYCLKAVEVVISYPTGKKREGQMLKKNSKSNGSSLKKNSTYAKTSSGAKNTKFVSMEKLQEMVRVKAYEIYRTRGNQPGDSLSDWVKAEKLVKRQLGINY